MLRRRRMIGMPTGHSKRSVLNEHFRNPPESPNIPCWDLPFLLPIHPVIDRGTDGILQGDSEDSQLHYHEIKNVPTTKNSETTIKG
jgi:hypothetical protein